MKIVESGYELFSPADLHGLIKEAKKIERAGRVAYKSEDKITSDSWKHFCKMIAEKNHGSVLEHGYMSAKFICDRGVTHELVRHRIASFTQESTRYVNYSKNKFGNEITVINPFSKEVSENQIKEWKTSCELAEKTYMSLLQQGRTPQEARAVLPHCLKSEIVISTNFREWRHILHLRMISKAAHPQVRELLRPFYEYLRANLPEIFDLGDPE